MIFSNRSPEDINISIEGQQLVKSEHERFLGVIIDSKLSWRQHIKQLKTKISRNAGVMLKLKSSIPNKAQKMLYNSLIQSHLYYCTTVWGTKSLNSIQSLFSAQKKAIRATDSEYHNYFYDNKEKRLLPSHTKAIFNKIGILALPNLIAKSCLTLMHKVCVGVAPSSIGSIFEKSPLRQTERRIPQYFEIKFNRLRITDNSISNIGPRLYNNTINEINKILPFNVPKLQNKFINSFKDNIVRYLLEKQKLDVENFSWTDNNFVLYNFQTKY